MTQIGEIQFTRAQAILAFDKCRSCGRDVFQVPAPPGSPPRFNYIVVHWAGDRRRKALVCCSCIKLHATPTSGGYN